AAEARPRAENRHLELLIDAADDLPPVAADPARLSQALSNLLDNALTYTPPGGTIRLSARVTEGGQMRLSVSDTGPGIPPEYLPRVFDRFFRVPGQSAPSGTGLGLAIVREVVASMGGTTRCESRPGEGTTFHLDLPVWTGG